MLNKHSTGADVALLGEKNSYLAIPQENERTCNGLAVFWPTMDLAEI